MFHIAILPYATYIDTFALHNSTCAIYYMLRTTYMPYTHSTTHTYISYFPQQNRALAGLSAEFSVSCDVVASFLFFVASIIHCADIMLCQYYCYALSLHMLYVSCFVVSFYRLIFCYFFVCITYTNDIKYAKIG